MIYLASPYSHPYERIRRERYRIVLRHTALLMQKGLVVFSPIVYGHQFAEQGLAGTCHKSWLDFNEHMLLASSELRVLQMNGWRASAGIEHEIKFAEENGIEVTYEAI